MDQLAQSIQDQLVTGGQINTQNPQSIPQTNPQNQIGQGSNLQNAGGITPDQLRALDQGTKPLYVLGTDTTALIGGDAIATTQQDTAPASNTNFGLYGALGLLAAACLAILAYGLLKPQHTK